MEGCEQCGGLGVWWEQPAPKEVTIFRRCLACNPVPRTEANVVVKVCQYNCPCRQCYGQYEDDKT